MLLGSLPKGDEIRKDWVDWKNTYVTTLKRKLPDVSFIHGDSISDIAGAEMVVGHDLFQVRQADVCVVDAQTKVGAGTAQEIVYAKYLQKPVVIVIPKNSHHRKTGIVFQGNVMKEWTHPFLKISTDYIAESIEDAAEWIKSYSDSPKSYKIKDISVFDNAIKKFELFQEASNKSPELGL